MRFIRRLVIVLAITLALGGAIGTATMWNMGWRAFILHTGSMTPHIPSGDLVIDRPVHSVKVGQVITFAKAPGQYTTHRVAALTASGIKTKGDANPTDDYGYATPNQVVGQEVLAIPYGGYVAEFFAQPTGVAALVLFLLGLWLAWGLFFPATEPASIRQGVPTLAVPGPKHLGQTPPGYGAMVTGPPLITDAPRPAKPQRPAHRQAVRRSSVHRRPAHRRRRARPLLRL